MQMVMQTRRWILVCVAAAGMSGLWFSPALAQSSGLTSRAIEGGIGFTSDPNTFLMTFGLPLGLNRNVSVVPHIQLGFNDNRTIVAPTASFRYGFSLESTDLGALRKMRPFLEGGLGILYVDANHRDGVGFLMNGGLGMTYPLNNDVSLISAMRFNGSPDGAAGEHFIYSWEVLGAQLHF